VILPLLSTVIDAYVYDPAVTAVLASVTGIDALAEPSKPALVPVASPDKENVRAVANAVAVLEFPVSAAVMVPAEKFPLESRATTVDEVFADVALLVIVMVPDVVTGDPETDRPVPDVATAIELTLSAQVGALLRPWLTSD
jgi:hypothetical protein